MEVEIIDNANDQIKKSNKAYLKFKEKHKDKITEKIECDICGGHYVYYSKSLHLRSKKHVFCVNKYNNSDDIKIEEPSVISSKKYNHKTYQNTFITKNKSKIMEKKQCEICCGSYTYYNRSKHYNSDRHIKMVNKNELLNNQNNH
jgi:hypothetical protein